MVESEASVDCWVFPESTADSGGGAERQMRSTGPSDKQTKVAA